MVVHTSAIRDACVITLRGVDDVRAGLAAKDLEGEVLRVALGAGGVARRDGVEGGG